jgi:hypothetical protein
MNLFGEVCHFSLRRLKCQSCSKHHRELPNIIQPFKHYDSETIQLVIDGEPDVAMCVADDSTMRRWKTTFTESEADISQRLTSVQAQISDETIPVENSKLILNLIRGSEKRWFSFVMALLINGGHVLRTQFAFCHFEICVMINPKIKKEAKEAGKNDKTFNDSS